ncbi:group II intron reverse transcriptase/maturase [Bacillus thuringiensis]|uniref:group II intron reverse transcriptase/maturase n=1 Tax=Bacillus thuringiensis TaxID=1428 RepID=UPI003B97FA10
MSQTALQRLEVLQKLNGKNKNWVNKEVYRLLYKKDLYIIAYERIKSKPGNMTQGTDKATIDGFSSKWIESIIHDLKNEKFQFKPVRRTEIPKANGGKRKLGIPTIRDKIVQEVMRIILDSIYDSPKGAYFHKSSHGFRPNKGTHTALKEYRQKWQATNWIIEGDIKGCFDHIDHHILINILKKKIQDEKFIRLTWKLLRAGYMEFGTFANSLIGTPQGGLVSPILANVYLHELDNKAEELKNKFNKGKAKRRNPEYGRIASKRGYYLKKNSGKITPTIKELTKQMRNMSWGITNDPEFIRLRYIRYADDWILGVCGSLELAKQVKEEFKFFLQEKLKLTLSEEKTSITHAQSGQAHFLGTDLSNGRSGGHIFVTTTTQKAKRHYKSRAGKTTPTMKASITKLVQKLCLKGFCTPNGVPLCKDGWTTLDTDQIISRFNSINRGIQNYYRFVDNFAKIGRIQYILKFSLAKTLAKKYRISVSKVFKRFGKNITFRTKSTNGKTYVVSFYNNHDWTRQPSAFQTRDTKPELLKVMGNMRVRSKLGNPCAICNAKQDIEMHHIRHIRRNKKTRNSFNDVLSEINRKQIPVCKECHKKIHRGEYDGFKLSNLAYDPR